MERKQERKHLPSSPSIAEAKRAKTSINKVNHLLLVELWNIFLAKYSLSQSHFQCIWVCLRVCSVLQKDRGREGVFIYIQDSSFIVFILCSLSLYNLFLFLFLLPLARVSIIWQKGSFHTWRLLILTTVRVLRIVVRRKTVLRRCLMPRDLIYW